MSDPETPYASPPEDSELVEATVIYTRPRPEDLPSRWLRLAAVILDGLILFVLAIPTYTIAYLLFGPFNYEVPPEKEYLVSVVVVSIALTLFYAMVNGYPLAKNGQTWGKKICSIKIVRLDGRPADLFRLICVRFFPILVMWQLPFVVVVPLIDNLYIFSEQRRCLHDLMAITIVVKAK